jgi:hypothetical protein
VLVWALGLTTDLPAYDVKATDRILRDFPAAELGSHIRKAALRPRGDVERQRNIAECWHWRSRTRQLVEDGRPFKTSPQLGAAGFASYDDTVRAAAAQLAIDEGLNLIDGDFPAMGKAYRDIDHHQWTDIRSITTERHFALNWLCGRAPSNRWDDTPTDT